MALTRPKASQINFDVTNISDPLIRLNSDETGTADKDSGLVIERGDDQNRGIIWDESADQWAFVNTTETGTTSGNVSIAAYAGLAVGQLNLADSAKIYLGTGNDFSLYHNANNSFISDQGTGGIYVLTNDFIVKNAASDETFLRASGDGDVELYYDNSQKLVTTSTGVTVTGTIVATSLTGDVTGDVTGNATTITASANNSTDETTYPIFVDGATGAQGVETDTGLTYNPSSGILTATSYAGSGANLTGISTTTTVTGLTDTTISSATSGQVLKYNGSAWVNNAEGATTTVTLSEMTGDGSDTTLTLEATPTSDDNLLVFVDSVLQDAGAWSRSGTTLTFSEAPANGAVVKAWNLLASTATNAAKLGALTGDGSTTAFSLTSGGSTYTPGSENSLIVSVNNVIQEPGSGKDFTVSGSTITFTSAPGNSHAIWIVDVGTGVTINTPADNSVTSAKIVNGAIVNADINASAGIDATKLADGTVTSTEFQYINSLSSNAQTQITARLPLTGGTMSGAVNMADQEILRPILRDYVEPRTNLAPGATVTCDMTNGNVFSVAVDQNTTFVFSNPGPANNSTSFTLVWIQDSSDRTITWPNSVKWAGGSAPDVTSGSGKVDIYTFFTLDTGTTWYGFQAGADMS